MLVLSRSTMTTKSDVDRNEAIAELRKLGVRPGAKILTKVTHVARSGMSRTIACYIVKGGEVHDISHLVARATGHTCGADGAVKIGGCGMNMCFALVYALGRVMFPKGGSLKHSPRAYQEREVGRETDGGYLLKYADL
jgi:hypothetical protein